MPRTKEQYEEMRTSTREKIQVAAVKLFSRRGFSATSVQDIADSAGISIGLLYRHYKTKDALFNELVSKAADGLGDIVKMFQSDASPVDLIGQLTLRILNDIANGEEFAEFSMLMNQAYMMEDTLSQYQYLMEQDAAMFEQAAHLIEKGQALGQFRQGDPSEMASCYFASIGGLAIMKFTMKDRFIVPSREIVTAFLIKEDIYNDSN